MPTQLNIVTDEDTQHAAAAGPADVVIVDYGMGNLYSIARACERAGLRVAITSSRAAILGAQGLILPGVGAFGDAMASLRRSDLVGPLREAAAAGTPLLGICFGMQLLMSESEEFGSHEGLNIVPGRVVRFREPRDGDRLLKVPHVGWNRIRRMSPNAESTARGIDAWSGTPLDGLADGASQYFVHSYHVVPNDATAALAQSTYGDATFCSALASGRVSAVQFHPERSGPDGLRIYGNFAKILASHSDREKARHAA